jgi:hypothetical protein
MSEILVRILAVVVEQLKARARDKSSWLRIRIGHNEVVVEQLKARGHGNGRSLQAELKSILDQAARPAPARPSRAEYRVLAVGFKAT